MPAVPRPDFFVVQTDGLPSGERLHFAMERSTMLLMGKSWKIHYFDWAIFNCYVSSPEGTHIIFFYNSNIYIYSYIMCVYYYCYYY